MTAGTPLRWLAWPGAAVLALTLLGLLIDAPATAGDARVFRGTGFWSLAGLTTLIALPLRALLWPATGPLHRGACPRVWPSLVHVPAILLLLADLRPWLAIKLRRGTENGEAPCPLRLP